MKSVREALREHVAFAERPREFSGARGGRRHRIVVGKRSATLQALREKIFVERQCIRSRCRSRRAHAGSDCRRPCQSLCSLASLNVAPVRLRKSASLMPITACRPRCEGSVQRPDGASTVRIDDQHVEIAMPECATQDAGGEPGDRTAADARPRFRSGYSQSRSALRHRARRAVMLQEVLVRRHACDGVLICSRTRLQLRWRVRHRWRHRRADRMPRGMTRCPKYTASQLGSRNKPSLYVTTRARSRNSSILCVRLSGIIHRPAVVPDRRVVTLGGVVVQDQEIAHAVVFHFDPAVVGVDDARIELPGRRGEVVDQRGDRDLDQIDAGRFERLEKSAREPDGDAIAIPGLAAPAGGEAQESRVGQRLAVESRHAVSSRPHRR